MTLISTQGQLELNAPLVLACCLQSFRHCIVSGYYVLSGLLDIHLERLYFARQAPFAAFPSVSRTVLTEGTGLTLQLTV